MQHTPGPWEVRQRDHVGDNVFAGDKRIANTFGPPDFPEYAANAQLIAAAPEMKAFIEEIANDTYDRVSSEMKDKAFKLLEVFNRDGAI